MFASLNKSFDWAQKPFPCSYACTLVLEPPVFILCTSLCIMWLVSVVFAGQGIAQQGPFLALYSLFPEQCSSLISLHLVCGPGHLFLTESISSLSLHAPQYRDVISLHIYSRYWLCFTLISANILNPTQDPNIYFFLAQKINLRWLPVSRSMQQISRFELSAKVGANVFHAY